jgi:hypothetical protein
MTNQSLSGALKNAWPKMQKIFWILVFGLSTLLVSSNFVLYDNLGIE